MPGIGFGHQTMAEHKALPAFAAWSGHRRPRILFLGEAWGQSESEVRRPFVGQSGFLLFELLGEAIPPLVDDLYLEAKAQYWKFAPAPTWVRARDRWLERHGLAMTNVIAARPPSNDIAQFTIPKTDLPHGYPSLPPLVTSPKQAFLRPEFLPELERLGDEIAASSPGLVVALGNSALWALARSTGISGLRGTIAASVFGPKMISTYHPAGVMRQWNWRTIVIADLMKAWRESEFREIRRPARRIQINPTPAEAASWATKVIEGESAPMAVDIETASRLITCIGFARSANEALVIPFRSAKAPGGSIHDPATERRLWRTVERLLASPLPKVFQNGMYDLAYLRQMGFWVANCQEDTMLLHHSLFPELQKGLGFLGSIYTSEPAWKLMRRQRATEVVKKDE